MTTRVFRLIRQYHQLSQHELAKELNLSVDRVNALESGTSVATRNELESYSKFFDVPLPSLLFLSEAVRGKSKVRSRMRGFMSGKCLDILEWLTSRRNIERAEL